MKQLCLVLPLLLFALAGCSKNPSPASAPTAPGAAQQTFAVRGILRGVNLAGQTVTVEHEEIPDYMPAMTMPFDFKSRAEIEPLSVGDGMAFDLIVTADKSWIQNVRKIPANEVRLPKSQLKQLTTAAVKVDRLKEGDRLPEFQLIDQKGRTVTRESFAGRPLLLTFIFTRCPIPTFCPLMSQNFKGVQEALAADASPLKSQVQYLSVSFDPQFDTPEVLASYAERYTKDSEQWRFATGTPEEIEKLTKAFSVYVQPESGSISHGLCTALIDPDGVIHKVWRGNSWQPSEVVDALRAFNPADSPQTAQSQ